MAYKAKSLKYPGLHRGVALVVQRGTILDEAMSRPILEVQDPYQDPRWENGKRDPYRLPSKN